MNFRIRKGTHVSHFHPKCALWPDEDFYERETPLWWGRLCDQCSRLADREVDQSRNDLSRNALTGC